MTCVLAVWLVGSHRGAHYAYDALRSSRLDPSDGCPGIGDRGTPRSRVGLAGSGPTGHLRQRRRTHLPEELSELPSVRRDRADGADDLRGGTSLGPRDQTEGG